MVLRRHTARGYVRCRACRLMLFSLDQANGECERWRIFADTPSSHWKCLTSRQQHKLEVRA